jgi:hypothetical protein
MSLLRSQYSIGLLLRLWLNLQVPCPAALEFITGLRSPLVLDMVEYAAGSQDGGTSSHGVLPMVKAPFSKGIIIC